MKNLVKGISNIGNKLVKCKETCAGICNDPQNGIIPRCLYLEYLNRNQYNGCVIVGINPGRTNNSEKSYYLKNGISYNTIVNFFEKPGRYKYGHPYYRYLRIFVDLIGYEGPILWTELVKCENDTSTNFPPLQTFRHCTHRYLSKELDLIPSDWPLIAIGREAHKALSYLYPTRSVLGIPHPTSSRGNFSGLFTGKKIGNQLTTDVQNQINNFKNNVGIETWLTK